MSANRTIGRVLDSLTELRPLMLRVHTLIALQNRYAQCIAPALAARSRISHDVAGTIHVQADSAAVAAKLRNLAPRILLDLQATWPNLTGIQIGTQPTPSTNRPGGPRTLDATGKQELTALSEKLPEGPLRNALRRISER